MSIEYRARSVKRGEGRGECGGKGRMEGGN